MVELNIQLNQLILETCRHPRGSLERQRGLNKIIVTIQKSGKLLKDLSLNGYEDALQQTWLYFCRNLCEATTADKFDADRANVITWFNAHLKYRLQDRRISIAKEQATRVNNQYDDSGKELDSIELIPSASKQFSILEEVDRWLETEVDQLRRIHLRDRPDINCQVLILRRLPPETPWKKLSQEFGVPISTLSNFYQRRCFPLLLDFGKSQAYL